MKREIDHNKEAFLGRIENCSSSPYEYLRGLLTYCNERCDASENASSVYYYMLMSDIVERLMSLRSMRTGEQDNDWC